MNFKKIVTEIHEAQLKTFATIDNFKGEKGTTILARKRRGLYWIWTKTPFEVLENVKVDTTRTQHVPIAKLIKQRKSFKNICEVTNTQKFKIVYNGIGGYKGKSKSFGLRERILQEITCNNSRTGTLNISKWENNLNHWGVSFFDFDAPENLPIVKQLKAEEAYLEYAHDLELLWRLEYGTPLLCRH